MMARIREESWDLVFDTAADAVDFKPGRSLLDRGR
jgi:hypothetical protein